MTDTGQAIQPIADDLLQILRCPVAVHYKDKGDDPGRLELFQHPNGDWWLISADSDHKYPIREGIPVMLVEVGEQWQEILVDDLPAISEIFKD
ncbi:Trm112 family protein [Chloroflexota bacterium]